LGVVEEMYNCTYLGKKKRGRNVKFDVKFRNLESMTKKRKKIIRNFGG